MVNYVEYSFDIIGGEKKMPLGTMFIADLSFVEMLFVIVLGWILVALWQRCIDNLTFNSLKLNKDSTYHTFIIALVATIIFLLFVFSFNSILGDIVESDVTGGFSPPGTQSSTGQTTANAISISDEIEIVEKVEVCTNCRQCARIF